MKVLVVDDEAPARQRLTRMLRRIAEVADVDQAGDGDEAVQVLRSARPDVVFLDVRMPGLDGIALAERLDPTLAVVFVTAHDAHAIRAFELDAVDYLLKPVSQARLEQALARARRRRLRQGTRAEPPPSRRDLPPALRVTARDRDTMRVFDAREISRFYAADKCTVFHHGGEEFVLDESLQTLEARLSPHGFVRVHRRDLVNVAHVRALGSRPGGAVLELADGQRAAVSRRSMRAFKRRLRE